MKNILILILISLFLSGCFLVLTEEQRKIKDAFENEEKILKSNILFNREKNYIPLSDKPICTGYPIRVLEFDYKPDAGFKSWNNCYGALDIVGAQKYIGEFKNGYKDGIGEIYDIGGRFFCADLKTAQTVWKYENTKSQFPISASAAVTDTTVIMASKDKNVYAFDPMTGHEQWRISTKSRIEASPVIANNIVLFATTAGNLYAIDIESGKQNWFFEIGFPIVAGPAIAAERLVIGDTNGTVYCFGSLSLGTGESEK